MTARPLLPTLIALAVLTGCASGPTRQPQALAVPAAFKEAPPGWTTAQPADGVERGPWWQGFGDPVLDQLATQALQANANLEAAAAALEQSQALVRQQRAALWPVLTASGGATRSGNSTGSGTVSSVNPTAGTVTSSARGNRFSASLGASWEADLWGRLRGGVNAAQAGAEASAADLAALRLSVTGELAANYLALRSGEAEAALLRETIAAYERSLQITQNRYTVGVAPKSDVLQAQTQLANARADLLTLERSRAQFEHAIAVLVGQAPGGFTLAPAAWRPEVRPDIPPSLPSTLLQRRPDIAAAQRRVNVAQAQIGIAQAALFPSLQLSASYGSNATRLGDLFSATAWSLGLSLAQTIFDAGARRAAIDQSQAAWVQSVANYRQTVLNAFQDVEDQLAALRVLDQQQGLRREAADAAVQTQAQVENRYRAGQVGYTEVVTAQVTALNARRALVQAIADRQAVAVALVRALGGGFEMGDLVAGRQ
ncbi:efflux transporter outer membrane subunit [Aquabacterium sp. J223]|uniref:efflux transporter outer membrane subunit n=1 Tax=Aquabacterium sp. J223 TaxID=2898431 RepID=UPI0021AD5E94|nr:efflux transporter outer membrane subunit [Aquabacterium sp. J223]UUX94383.1 efflux transporter outer membrane subunit [Aquabacterium sp. J223]